jgi:hypothetical protein
MLVTAGIQSATKGDRIFVPSTANVKPFATSKLRRVRWSGFHVPPEVRFTGLFRAAV